MKSKSFPLPHVQPALDFSYKVNEVIAYIDSEADDHGALPLLPENSTVYVAFGNVKIRHTEALEDIAQREIQTDPRCLCGLPYQLQRLLTPRSREHAQHNVLSRIEHIDIRRGIYPSGN